MEMRKNIPYHQEKTGIIHTREKSCKKKTHSLIISCVIARISQRRVKKKEKKKSLLHIWEFLYGLQS